ncbi:hypothetical protein N0V84_010212 [Fusarium piperis]|uniref:Uncharacterized protein n=1 Tax=Fusarium piperis TaxID=1435070 RepID=A0A9W8W4V7_9HYPO|nr:hypothetical protein N0V84_010212 [Fusarium piperis]
MTSTSISVVGPLPTDYSPGTTCNAISSRIVVGIDFATSCLPDDFDPAPTAYYSPGTACPSGYTAQRSCTRSNSGDDRTTVTCCPERNGIKMWCVENPQSLEGPWESLYCTWSAGDSRTVLLVTTLVSGSESTSAVTMSGGDGINAYGLKMVYEASDIASTSATTTSDATTADATTDTTELPAETSSSGGSGNDGGIGTGGIVAIAVVIPLVVIGALIGGFFWWRRRKNRITAIPTEDPDATKELPPSHGVSELYGTQSIPQELPTGSSYVSELPGDGPMHGGWNTNGSSSALSNSVINRADGASPRS